MTASPEPRENPRLLGHEAAERHLLDAWAGGKLAHGWLITGPKGIGKMTLACRFARFLLANPDRAGDDDLFAAEPSPPPESLEVAEEHPVFRRIAANGHADLHVVERGFKGNDADTEPVNRKRQTVISVDDVRSACRSMALTSSEGGWRIVVVDGADEMNANAANALLKLLEEPPARSVLILVAHSGGRLPPTIASRCCQLRLRPLGPDTLSELMGVYRPQLDGEARRRLIGLADGSIGRALALADGEGLAVHDDLMALLAGLPDLDMPAAHRFTRRFGRAEADLAWQTATDLIVRCLNRMISAGARRTELPEMGFDAADAERLTRLLGMASLDCWLGVWEKTSDLFAQANSVHLDRRQVMLDVLGILQAAARSGTRP